MKFSVSSSSLLNHLQAISRVINAKNSLPILDCFLFDLEGNSLSLTASDSETTLATTLEVVECDGPCRFAASAKTILDAIKEIPEQPLSIEINPGTLEITVLYQNGQFKMVGQNADEYPATAALGDSSVKLSVPADILLNGVSCTLFATAEDELRPIMNGIYFDITPEELIFVASDGHKLVRCRNFNVKCGEKASFILPKKPAILLKNLLAKEQEEVVVEFDERNAVFAMSNYRMVCRLIERRYPNYNSVIPQNNPHKLTIDRLAMLGALRRVSVCSSQATSLIKLRLDQNLLEISAQDLDFSTSAQETLTCAYEGAPMSIGFKASFLIDILGNLASQEVIVELADPTRAGVIVPAEQIANGELLMLIMPLMLND